MGAAACTTAKTPRTDEGDQSLNGIKMLTPEQIKQIHEQIEKSQDSLAVKRSTLKRVLRIDDIGVENIFKKFDKSQSGYIDTYELLSAIIFLSRSTFDEKAQLLFSMYDTNMSTTLELDELTILIKNALTALMSVENKKAPNIEDIELRTKEFFQKADEDRNNVISFKEFKSYLRKEKFVVEAILKFGVADPAELGNDFGTGAGGLPEIHEDLDAECNPNHPLTIRQKAVRKEIPEDQFAEEDLGQGDQFMAVKPWLGVIKNSVPSNYRPSKNDQQGPDATLELEYVFGYRCHDTRNNLRYSSDGKLVYHTAGVGIVMDTITNTQKFFRDHKSDVLCLAVNPAGTICVTGESSSHLCVWDLSTQTIIEKVSKPMKKGIRHVAFSPDGRFIAASDMTDDHVCTIFELLTKKDKNGKMISQIASGNGGKANVMSLGFNATGDQVVATCVKDVLFYSWADGKLTVKKGSGWGTGAQAADTILSQAVVGSTVFTGNVAGEIISWNGQSIGKRTKAHEEKVNCLYAQTNGLISGGGDGFVYTWIVNGGALTRDKTFSLKSEEIHAAMPAAISVCQKDGRILVGTRGGEIVEFQQQNPKTQVHMRSHFDDELWGLVVHPTRCEIYTWGRDCMLGVWDVKQRKQIRYTKLDSGGDALAFSPDGSQLVVGFLNGSFIVLDSNLKVATKRRDRAGKAIQVIKFSPDGSICAQGGHDQLIITYDANHNFTPLKKIKKHSSTIKFLDFSLDGQVFQSLCQAYEILYFDVSSGKQVTSGASQYKDEKWSTWSLSLGWPVQGIFPAFADGSDINAVERSQDHTIVATGDDFSKVKLFRYPNPIEKAPFKEYTGHSSHVTNVSFSRNQFGQKYLISTGGRDKAIFCWKYLKNGVQVQQEIQPVEKKEKVQPYSQQSQASTAGNSFSTSRKPQAKPTQQPVETERYLRQTTPEIPDDKSEDLDRAPAARPQRPRTAGPQKRAFELETHPTQRRRPTSSVGRVINDEDERELHPAEFAEVQAEGDEAGATKPCVGTIVAMTPKGFIMPSQPQPPPKQTLTLKWAHGFRSFDTSGNLKYVKGGDNFVFTTAGVGVVQNPKTQTQKFFNLHKEDIVSMTYNKQANVVATGQMAGKELNEEASNKKLAVNTKDAAKSKISAKEGKLVDIMIWDAETCELICKLPLTLRRAVRQLAFSPDGNLLLGIGQDDQSTAVVFDWKNKKKLSEVKCQPIDKNRPEETVIGAAWKEDGTEFATCGPKHLKTYSKEGKNTSNCQVADFKSWITTVNFVLSGKLLTGTSDGELIQWNGTAPAGKPLAAHDKGCRVFCIERAEDSTQGFYSGGNDGQVFFWNSQLQKTLKVDLKKFNLVEPGVKSLDFKNGDTFLCGTYGAQVVEATISSHQVFVSGHYKDPSLPKWDYPEVWGCTTHPTQQHFASAGGDRRVRIWDMNKMLRVSEAFDRDITSLSWSPNGKFIACGDRESKVRILDAQTLVLIDVKDTHVVPKMKQVGTQWIEDIKFSPDGSQVAFGHHGYQSKLEVIKLDAKGKISGLRKSMMMSSALLDLDWSQSGEHVIVTNQSYEILIFNVSTGKIDHDKRPSGHVDTQWQTYTQRLGFPVQGIWPGIDMTDVNSVDRSKNSVVIATGDDFGMVKLFKYPCVTPKAKFNEYCGHSSHVTKVRFSANDENLVSTGGNDMTVFIWDTDINGPDGVFVKEWEANDNNPDDPSLEIKVDRSKAKLKAAEREEKKANKVSVSEVEDEFQETDMGPGDEFLAVLPWKGQCKPPTSFTKPSSKDGQAPAIDIKLEWVHGYRGSNTRNNLQFMSNGQLAYFAAGLGIVYDPSTHTQKFFDAHGDDVTAMTFSPDGKHIASGENGKRPFVYIWDSETMERKFTLRDNGIKGNIQALAYSPSGKILGVVDMSDDHNIALYDTTTGECLVASKGDRACVLDIAFQNDDTFVTAGVKHFKQYTFDGTRLKSKLGNFGGLDQRIGSCEFSGNDCLTGSINGDLYKWNGTTVSLAFGKLHSRMIDAITVTDQLIFTGGRDSQIQVLSKDYSKLFTINLSTIKNSVSTQIRAISLNKSQDCLMIGTFGHEIIKCPIQIQARKQSAEAEVLIHGHYAPATMLTNEAWGLSVFSNKNLYVSSSDDGTMRIWDTETRKQFAMLSTSVDMQGQEYPKQKDGTLSEAAMGRSMDISSDGKYIAVGMRDGSVRIYEGPQNWKLIAIPRVGRPKKQEWIEDLKFSPDNKFLVVSSHDNFLYLFETPNFSKEAKRFGVSSSFITHIDWSIASDVVRTNDGSYELLYYTIPDGKQNKSGASAYRDSDWATNSCVLGWAVAGIWQQGMDGSDINHADRSNRPVNGSQLLATADDFGKVSVYRYPCPVERAQSVQGKGHSSHVTKVRFNSTDEYLYSVGGNDTTVMQWKISAGSGVAVTAKGKVNKKQ